MNKICLLLFSSKLLILLNIFALSKCENWPIVLNTWNFSKATVKGAKY